MLQNNFYLLILIFSSIAFCQEKKVDTIYVYEEVIIHDTIYIEKPLDKIKLENVIFTKGENNEKDKLELTQNGKKIQIQVDSTNNSLFKELNAPNTVGFGLGIWVQKKLFDSNFSIGVGLDGLYWSSSFSFDATQNNSAINGYYFTENNEPLLFQSIENKHFQYQIPIQLYFKIKKFTPSIGMFASISNYKATFKGSSGNLPLTFDETQVYNSQALQIGYLVELQYEITKHISIGINFSSGKTDSLVFVNKNNKNQTFKAQNSFSENRWLAQLIYRL
jgi:hypothetical protein